MKKIWNSLSGRIIITVILGMIIVTTMVGSMIIRISEGIFINTFGEAQHKVFTQLGDNLNEYYENLSEVMAELDRSRGFRYVFHDTVTEEEAHSIKHFAALHRLNKDIETALTKHITHQKFLLVGENGKTYMNQSEALNVTVEEILMDEVTKKAAQNPETIHFCYREGGFSQSTKNMKVVMAVKAFRRKSEPKPYAYAYVTLTETDLEKFFNFFVTETNDFYALDEQGRIVATNQKAEMGKMVDESRLQHKELEAIQIHSDGEQLATVFYRELPYFHFHIYGVIDNTKALGQLYETKRIALYSVLLAGVVVAVIILIIQYSLKPLQLMSAKMEKIKDGDFDEYMEPGGSSEIIELANTYNYMLDDMKQYIDALMKTQKEKRQAEIDALQMQINPHYIYNTLAGIKWLMFQGETEKSAKMIDSFIYLLRNTISDTDEYITVRQEAENLKNYVQIQQIRYGEQIRTEFFVLQDCENALMPKMILQPIVENAFFHGFSSREKGVIEVFFKEEKEQLVITVQDDGVGMTEEEMHGMTEKKHEKFSGIGVNNIQERLQLIYGNRAGMQFYSVKNMGTMVTIRIPMKRERD